MASHGSTHYFGGYRLTREPPTIASVPSSKRTPGLALAVDWNAKEGSAMSTGRAGRGRLAQVLASRGGLAPPEAPFVIEHREALIYMLCEAAELEHGMAPGHGNRSRPSNAGCSRECHPDTERTVAPNRNASESTKPCRPQFIGSLPRISHLGLTGLVLARRYQHGRESASVLFGAAHPSYGRAST